ncbi:MAG: hypothetical protein K2J29_10270 [Muribaculaceae bacterium]|nr:hypothetical protein [Muribaculaceae bacterium]
MADWEEIGKTTAKPNIIGGKNLIVSIHVKLIGSNPMYKVRLPNGSYEIVIKYPLKNMRSYYSSYNAQFTYDGQEYLLNVPYWD